MPVKNFDKYLSDQRLVRSEATQQLKGSRLGIDGNHWLRKVQKSLPDREPLVNAMGGVPLGLKKAIEKEISGFKEAGIVPYFVFNGLMMTRSDRPFASQDSRIEIRRKAWEQYHMGALDLATSQWTTLNPQAPELVNFTLRILNDLKIDYIRAPYLPGPQLLYLEKQGYIHGIYAGTETLMFRTCRIITNINFEKNTFDWVDGNAILDFLGISEEFFLDACILSGFDFLGTGTSPPFNDLSLPFSQIVAFVMNCHGGYNLVMEFGQQFNLKPNYQAIYLRALDSIRCHPFLDENCNLVLMGYKSNKDLFQIFGPKFPDVIYFLLSQCLISPQTLNPLVSMTMVEFAPPCNGETREYRDYLRSLHSLKTEIFGLFSHPLARGIKERLVTSYYWFENPNGNGEVSHPMIHTETNFPERLKKQIPDLEGPEPNTDFVSCLRSLPAQRKTATPIEKGSLSQVISKVLLRVLELREFLNSNFQLTSMGNALKATSPTYHDHIFVALDLLKSGYLNAIPFNHLSIHPPNIDSPSSRLLSRVFSILPIHFKGLPWTSQVDFDLLCFNSILKTLERTLGNLCEMTTVFLFMTKGDNVSRKDFKEIHFGLPFNHETNTAGGLILKHHLAHHGTPNYSPQNLQTIFPSCEDPVSELKKGFEFWDELMKAVAVLEASKDIRQEVFKQFQAANELLAKARF